jgi:hypothetical protein
MPFVGQKEFAEWKARIVALEEKLGIGVEIPSIEHVVTLHGIYGDEDADLLISGGFKTPDAVKVASDEELREVKGLGPAAVKRIRKAGKE